MTRMSLYDCDLLALRHNELAAVLAEACLLRDDHVRIVRSEDNEIVGKLGLGFLTRINRNMIDRCVPPLLRR